MEQGGSLISSKIFAELLFYLLTVTVIGIHAVLSLKII